MAFSDLGLGLICGLGGIALGWGARAYVYPTDVSQKASAEQAQQFVTAAVKDDREIIAAQSESDIAAERVRTVYRTITVDKACEPGRGPISHDLSEQLRADFATQ